MKKKFFFKFFLLAVFGTLVTFTACKDYDDDIDDLQNQITNLSGVKTDLESVKADIATAKTDAANALAKANDALAKAEAAGDAVAIKAAKDAADAAQAKADDVEAKATELEGLIEALEGRVAILEALDSPSKQDLEALDAEMKAIVLKLEALVGKNLRSLVLIPHHYVNGVEAIGFNPLAYYCLDSDNEGEDEGDYFLANPNYVTVQYFVNPSSVTEDMIDVDNLSFTYKLQVNKTRSADIDPKAEFVSLENGILTVRVELDANEAETGGLGSTIPSSETMDMIALQVPLSEKAKEEDADYEAVITSDWARVDVEPMTNSAIDRIGDTCDQDDVTYSGTYNTVALAKNQDDPHLLELVYDKEHSLLDYVTSTAILNECGVFDPADYGLVWNFDLLDENDELFEYVLTSNNTEQQEFINLLDNQGKIEARVYDAEPGAGASAAVGRTPIVRVQLIDPVTECVVQQGFVKIQWVKEQPVFDAEYPAEDVDFTCDTWEFETIGGAASDMGINIKTKWMNTHVMNAMGTDYKEFIHNYTLDEVGLYDADGQLMTGDDDWGTVVSNLDDSTTQPEVTDLFSVYLDNTCLVTENTSFTGYVHYTDAVTGEVALRIKVTININMPDLTVAGHNNTYWQGGNNSSNVFNVNPVQYATVPQIDPTAEYRTDLLNGFTDGIAYTDVVAEIVKSSITGHEPCNVEFVFDEDALEDYTFVIDGVTYSSTIPTPNLRIDNNGKNLEFYDGTNWILASDIKRMDPMPSTDGTFTNAGETINLNPDANEFAQALVGKKVPVKLAADLCCDTDCDLSRDIRMFEVYFIPPMHINSTFTESFEDWITGGDYIDLADAFTLTDFAKYLVALATPTDPTEKEKWAADLWEYYEINNVVWDIANATCNIGNVGGDLDVVPGANNPLPETYLVSYVDNTDPDNPNSLRFQNNSGAPLAKEFELYVPVTVGHKWGTLTETITIKVLPPQ